MMSNDAAKITLEALNGLSEEEKKVALEALKQIAASGSSDILNDLQYADFEEIPVDIDTFMHDPKYLGKGLTDPEGRFTVFPYWEATLKKIFPDNLTTAYNTLVFTGAIGLGKSTIAVICLLYMLYRLLCLKDPYNYYGMQPIDKLSISLMNITLENAKGVALDKMNQLILQSDWLMSHGTMAGTANLIFRPEKHIEIITASSNNQVIGRALFANFTDEVNFSLVSNPEKQKKKMMKLITQIDARMKSRFLRGTYLPTLNIIASSKDTEQSFLEAYINTKRETESKNTLIIDEPQWVVDSRKDSPIKFWVGVGNKFLANELLPVDATDEEVDKYRRKGYQMWHVPIGYLDTFQTNLDEAICSVIGIATASSLKYISGERLNKTKTDKYKNPFVKDVIEVGNAETDHLQYANFFDLNRVLPNDMNYPLFIHLDMSTGGGGKGDKTGIAGVIITGKRPTTRAQAAAVDDTGQPLLNVDSTEDNLRELQYKVLFSVSIKAPQGCQISFEKNRNFIRWLRDKGFNIKGISSDTFQSAQIQQELKSDGFEAQIISVDRVDKQTRTCLPYHYLKTAIYEQRITLYDKCDQLTDELVSLERLSDGHIDHPQNGSKDQADAVCGAVYLASKFSEEYSYNYVENLDASLDVSLEESNSVNDRRQKMVDFESELTKLYTDTYAELEGVDRAERERKKQEWAREQDILDGIIAL